MDRPTAIFADGIGAAAATSGVLNQLQGRIFALLYMVINGVSAIPVLVAAALADTIGTAQVLGGLGVVLLVGGLGVIAGGLHVHEPRKEPSRSRPG